MKKRISMYILFLSLSITGLFALSLGDANGDGAVNIIDATIIAQKSVNLDPKPFYLRPSDVVGCDCEVNIVDAMVIARYYVGLENSLPCQSVFNTYNHNFFNYEDRQVFIVSDENWRVPLTLLPAVIWQTDNQNELYRSPKPYGSEDNICAFPVLVYHVENGIADLDPIIHFLNEYNTSYVTYCGDISQDVISHLNLTFNVNQMFDYFSYFNNIEKVIIVQDNYELALQASCYASLLGIPLIIEGYNDNIDLSDKYLVGVGNTTTPCDEYFDSDQLQTEYLSASGTDKIVLTNTADLDEFFVSIGGPIPMEWETGSVNNLFYRLSLASPFLSAAKKQLLLPYTGIDKSVEAIDLFLENFINNKLMSTPGSLTIMAGPNQIPQAKYGNFHMRDSSSTFMVNVQTDGAIYADLNKDYYQDFKIGRIYSFSVSGTSTNIARSLFYNKLYQPNNFTVFNSFHNMAADGYNNALFIENLFTALGYNNKSFTLQYSETVDIDILKDNVFYSYHGHGSVAGGNNSLNTNNIRNSKIWLSSTVGVGSACLMNSYDSAVSYENSNYPPWSVSFLYGAEMIRRGSIAFLGATDPASSNSDVCMNFSYRLCNGMNLGDAFMGASRIGCIDYVLKIDPFYMLLGDPTFNPEWNLEGTQDNISVQPGAMENHGTYWIVPVDVILQSAATQYLENIHIRYDKVNYEGSDIFVDKFMDSNLPPSFGSLDIKRSFLNYTIQRYAPPVNTVTEYLRDEVNVCLKIPNPQQLTYIGVNSASRLINGQEEDVKSNFQSNFHVVLADITFIPANLKLGDSYGLTIDAASLPEVHFHLELRFE